MKKILVILLAALCLTACSGKAGNSKLSDGDTAIITGPDYTYTKNELYNTLKLASQSIVETDLLNKIAESIEIDFEEIDKQVEESIEMYISIGYLNENDVEYATKQLRNSAILEKLSATYVMDNYDNFVKEDKPAKFQFAYFTDLDSANKFIDDVNNGSTFDAAAANNGYTQQAAMEVHIDSDEDIPVNVKSYLNDTASTGLSTIIDVQESSTDADGNITTTDKYYVLNIDSKNPDEFREDYINAKIARVSTDTVKNYFFENHDIKFYDQDIYEVMKEAYEVFR